MNKAILDWSLCIECPSCEADIDLADHDEEGLYSRPIFNNEWNILTGEEVECPNCHAVFKIDKVEC